jgi:hypothetical protein
MIQPTPIIIRRNRIPCIRLIKRPDTRPPGRDAMMFFAGACSAVFLILLGVAAMVWHPFR